jgi:NAD(P)-dependent dehydrogenase (short-subunit alcohol dehydrogenase family)
VTIPQHRIGSGFGARSTTEEVLRGIDLTGELAVVTGGHSGLGLETTRALAEKAVAGIDGVEVDELDLSGLDSVRGFAGYATDSGQAARLWKLSAELTGVDAFAATV